MIKENLERVRARIIQAAQSVGRNPAEVTLVCVTKGVEAGRIQQALEAGAGDLGENRVQEAIAKQAALGTWGHVGARHPGGVRWHLIGHLQRNKAKFAVELFDWIHSVDSLELIDVLERQAAERRASRPPLGVLIEVNVSGEATKHGCRPEEAPDLAKAIQERKHLEWKGLMTMAPFSRDPESSRPIFRRLRALRDGLPGGGSLHLSMGMSQDFEVAVQERATLVRIGTAIFGERGT